MRYSIVYFFSVLLSVFSLRAQEPTHDKELCMETPLHCPWLLYYGPPRTRGDFSAFQLLILDPEYSPHLASLLEEKKQLLAYFSCGTVADYLDYFHTLKEAGALLGESPIWPGFYIIDIRSEKWQQLILTRLIPNLLVKGFQGLYIDTLDIPLQLEEEEPELYKGMQQAAMALLESIHKHFPTLELVLHESYWLAEKSGHLLQGIVCESLFTDYNLSQNTYKQRVPCLAAIKRLKKIHANYPHLTFLSLDYWPPSEVKKVKEIYALARHYGFRPYVTLPSLTQITPEP